MHASRDSSLELFAQQTASLVVDPSAQPTTLARYRRALLEAFREVAADTEQLEPWTPATLAARAMALLLAEASGDLVRPRFAPAGGPAAPLARAIVQVLGPDVRILTAYASGAPRAPPPISATFGAEHLPPSPALENPMAPTSTRPEVALTDRLAAEANEAAWLIFAGKSVEVAQQGVGAFLQRHLADGDPALRARIGTLMQTKRGEVVTALVLSAAAQTFGSSVAERVGVSPTRIDCLASKLRVHALSSGGKALVDELLGPFMAQLTDLIRAMPEAEPAPLLADHRTVAEARTEPARVAV